MKIMKPTVDPKKRQNIANSFWNEVEKQNGLNHPNIVRLLAYSESGVWRKIGGDIKHENVIYILTENCARGELFDLVMAK